MILSVPVGTYLVSQYRSTQSRAEQQKLAQKVTKVVPKTTASPAKQLLESAGASLPPAPTGSPSPSPTPTSATIATSYGPTLSFKVTLEGRPAGKQSGSLFVGIAEGTLETNPKFLLSFSINLPPSGEYGNISLAGLNPGSIYTALLKGSAQIAGSVQFTMSPAISNLNNSEPIMLLSGDLNDDNIINSADYSIARQAVGTTAKSGNWNENADLNKDGVINIFDLSIIIKNMGKTGASGAWTSPIPTVATPSASLSSPIGGPGGQSGHWIWVPELKN